MRLGLRFLLFHVRASVLLMVISYADKIPHAAGELVNPLAYIGTLLFFALNLPGVLLVSRVIEYPVDPAATTSVAWNLTWSITIIVITELALGALIVAIVGATRLVWTAIGAIDRIPGPR